MARKTKKYVQALATVKLARIYLTNRSHETVYQELEGNNFFWNSKKGEWQYKEHAPSTSIFEADDGTPTGIVKIRVMAHPDDLGQAINYLKSCPGMRVIEISEKSYPNRKGTGERIYTTAILERAR